MLDARRPDVEFQLREAAVLGFAEGSGAVMAAGLARLGVHARLVEYADPGLPAQLVTPRPDLLIVDAAGEAAARLAQRALGPVLDQLRELAVPVLAATTAETGPPSELLVQVDDVLLPPYEPAEALLRAVLITRRRGTGAAHLLSAGPLTVDVEGFRAWLAGTPLSLTFTEFQLLRLLLLNRGKVLTRETLLNKVWGFDYYGGLRTVDVHIRRLRAKLQAEAPAMIETVRHVGYRIAQ